MTVVDAINALGGWGLGYEYSYMKRKDDEISQGKNFYLAIGAKVVQVMALGAVTGKLADYIPHPYVKVAVQISSALAPIIAIPIAIIFAAVRHGQYPQLAATCRSYRIRLPSNVRPRVASEMVFMSEHSAKVMRVAMIAGTVALGVLGQTYFAGAALAAIGYEVIDSRGWIPRKISLFMEKYMPAISTLGLFLNGSIILKVLGTVTLLSFASQRFSNQIHQRVDQLVRRIFPNYFRGTPSMQELDQPWVERTHPFNAAEINTILEAHDHQFELNPAHMTKWVHDLSGMPQDHDFAKFLALFNRIDWAAKYPIVKLKLMDDDRFMQELSTAFPGVRMDELKARFDFHVLNLASRSNMSRERFVASWLQSQMVTFTNVIRGLERAPGTQMDLDDAIQNCPKILAYLQRLELQGNIVELEDALLKISVECAKYCTRGYKNAISEMMGAVVRNYRPVNTQPDPIRDFELKIKQDLLDRRMQIVQAGYQALMRSLHIPEVIINDVHGFDTYRLVLSLGLVPLTDQERSTFGVGELLLWAQWAGIIRLPLLDVYRESIDDVAIRANNEYFSTYINNMIQTNPLLNEQQKEAILERWYTLNNGLWRNERVADERFARLLFMKVGIIRWKR